MANLLTTPAVQAVLGIGVLCVLIAGGFWLVSIYRDRAINDWQEPGELLANFEEMHREGDISEKEFRTIKASMRQHHHPSPADSGRDGYRTASPGPD